MTAALPVHPFPARMAPELALARLPRRIDGGLTVLDPMMGSGTIPVLAAQQGYSASGFDSDPLAVMIARTTGRVLDGTRFVDAAGLVVERARAGAGREWRHADSETQEFINFWFDRLAQWRLGALASAISEAPAELHDPLWCAFSRLIITKDVGASRARDVSHSRPHRVRECASFDPIERFDTAVAAVLKRHRQVGRQRPPGARLRLALGDARKLPIGRGSVDVVMTSPPYLQAIDYLRGHRMSLVWMGHTIAELRDLRGTSIGTERGVAWQPRYEAILAAAVDGELSARASRTLAKYVEDLGSVLSEIHRVLRSTGRATLVVADATISGHAVSISALTKATAKLHKLNCIEHSTRDIPTGSRYLPPPRTGGSNSLDRRMRTEHCITFCPTQG